MSYCFHPEAAMEYAEQVAHYRNLRESLGERYHAAGKTAALKACAAPDSYRAELPPAIRRVPVGIPLFPHLSRSAWKCPGSCCGASSPPPALLTWQDLAATIRWSRVLRLPYL